MTEKKVVNVNPGDKILGALLPATAQRERYSCVTWTVFSVDLFIGPRTTRSQTPSATNFGLQTLRLSGCYHLLDSLQRLNMLSKRICQNVKILHS
jgi:hypothetical protein